ncbi:unnamed protein product [Cyclocybe aegerita]|uniref:Uncharacterized protein n=1 Tax=Cyclocybe aegerita TaxID=1973307 RepID=A0A8S0VRV2_CYCAE|nr:unnamed protein product [Cyclocybe aegerita]
MKISASSLLFFVPTALARLYVSEGVQVLQDTGCHCRPAQSIELYRPKCANASAADHSFSYSANSDLPPDTFIVVGVNSTWEFLNYIGCPGVSVKRLLLSDSIDEDIIKNFGDYRQVSNHSDPYEIEMVRHHNRLLDIKWEDAYQDYVVAIMSILEHIAPTLEALSWVSYNPKSAPKGRDNGVPVPSRDLVHWSTDGDFDFGAHTGIGRVPYSPLLRKFPLLTELTLRSPSAHHRSPLSADTTLTFNISDWALPSLTHLHLASYIPYSVMHRLTVTQTSRFWRIPSNVAYIRLTGSRALDSCAPWTRVEEKIWDRPGAWERVMRVFRGASTLTIRPPELLPNLTIIVQPGFPPSNDTDPYDRYPFGSIEEFSDNKERCSLAPYDRQLNRTLSNPRVHVKLPEKAALERYGASSGVYSLKEAIEEFSSRSRGEDAGWSIPKPVTEEGFWWWKDGKPPLRCFDGVVGREVLVD